MSRFWRLLYVPLFVAGIAVPVRAPAVHAQWVQDPGTGWAQIQFSHQQTREGFDGDGEVVPLVQTPGDDGQSIITTVRLTGALGLVQGVDVWGDLPFHRQAFNTSNPITEDLLETGFGDARVYLRIGPSLFGLDVPPIAVALRGGAKFTSGNFSVRSETISLSEGQRDWELLLELGRSLHVLPIYVMAWGGYRWRERNDQTGRNPGDEALFYAAAGGSWNQFRWKLGIDGLFGQPSTVSFFEDPIDPPRELVQVIPQIGWRIGPGTLRAGARFPVHGQSVKANQLPASPTVTLGYFVSWNSALWR